MKTVIVAGASGTMYDAYTAYLPNSVFPKQPGNYLFGRFDASGKGFHIFYIGQTQDLSTRFGDHHKWPMAARLGATHIAVRVNWFGEAARKLEERDLCQQYKPPCNEQLVSPPINFGLLGALRRT